MWVRSPTRTQYAEGQRAHPARGDDALVGAGERLGGVALELLLADPELEALVDA